MKTCFLHRPVLLTILLLNFVIFSEVNGQKTEAYPTNWFTQMQFNKIQILFLQLFLSSNWLGHRSFKPKIYGFDPRPSYQI